MQAPAANLPLSTLLSQVLVAFTIEFDNESEHRMPHRTERSRAAGEVRSGPWLVSMVMYLNFLQYVGDEGITVRALKRRAQIEKLSLAGMERWGYVSVETGAKDPLVRLKPKGRVAQQVWQPLFGLIEQRWQERFGKAAIDGLRDWLTAVVKQLDRGLPEYMPVLHYGLVCGVLAGPAGADTVERLPTLLSRVLLSFALEFESESELSLAICANVMRVIGEVVRLRDLPQLGGVSKESISMAVNFLTARNYVTVEADPASPRVKLVRLTAKGRVARQKYFDLLRTIEERWRQRFGEEVVAHLRGSLEPLVGERLFQGLEPYPDNWRAAVRKPETLPHFPMVLHRGGYPDGS